MILLTPQEKLKKKTKKVEYKDFIMKVWYQYYTVSIISEESSCDKIIFLNM